MHLKPSGLWMSPSWRTWSVQRLSNKGVINPNGLWLFSGTGRDDQGTRPWSIVLKLLTRSDPAPPPDDLWHWKREMMLALPGLFAAWFGCIFPGGTAMWCHLHDSADATQLFGAAEEELFWKWLPLFEFSMDCADEARTLTARLGLR